MSRPLLSVRDLQTHFFTAEGVVAAVDGVSFDLEGGKVKGIVGESGCGKSITARSIMRMVQPPGKTVAGEIWYTAPPVDAAVDLLALPESGSEMRSIRGGEIGMIFQEPRAALSPIHTIGSQIMENVRLHRDVTETEARDLAEHMLERVHIPRPDLRMTSYPHQLSGGMCQRIMIAMALSCQPRLLIADEPTTALDVTTEAQILELLEELDLSMMFITHDLGVVAEIADEVVVMYLGRVVEQGTVEQIFYEPHHPYTRDLLSSLPRMEKKQDWLTTMRGSVPDPYHQPPGCPFHPRCSAFKPGLCDVRVPQTIDLEDGRQVRCLLYEAATSPADHAA